VYPLSIAQFIYGGPPQTVSGWQWLGESGVDESFVGQMRYPNGGFAQIACGFRTPFHTHVTVLGTDGRIDIARPFVGHEHDTEGMRFTDADGNSQRIDVPRKELYLGQVENMHAAILDGAALRVTHAQTRQHVQTVLALYRSAENGGQPVTLDS
jgi:predicted dehydrogenase